MNKILKIWLETAKSIDSGFQVNKKIFIGYGYDMDSTKLSGFDSGSHEIILRFELFNDKNKLISPRFF